MRGGGGGGGGGGDGRLYQGEVYCALSSPGAYSAMMVT